MDTRRVLKLYYDISLKKKKKRRRNCITTYILERLHLKIPSYFILLSSKITLLIIPYNFTIFPISQLLFYNITH